MCQLEQWIGNRILPVFKENLQEARYISNHWMGSFTKKNFVPVRMCSIKLLILWCFDVFTTGSTPYIGRTLSVRWPQRPYSNFIHLGLISNPVGLELCREVAKRGFSDTASICKATAKFWPSLYQLLKTSEYLSQSYVNGDNLFVYWGVRPTYGPGYDSN